MFFVIVTSFSIQTMMLQLPLQKSYICTMNPERRAS